MTSIPSIRCFAGRPTIAVVLAALATALPTAPLPGGSTAHAAEVAGSTLVWFGTHTGSKGNSEGIYVSRFDGTTGMLSPPVPAAKAIDPSFLALHPRLPVLYAVSEADGGDGKPVAAVLSFTIDEATGGLAPKNHQPSGGRGPCHVSVDPAGKVALAAHFGDGSVVCLGLAADGGLEPAVAGSPGGVLQHEGQGPNPRRQGPHAHSIYATPDGRFAIACDLGLDKVFVHRLDAEKATLAPHGFGAVAPGAGPRHFALHPGGRYGYVVNERDLTVTVLAFDPQAGTLVPAQSLSTLPADVVERKGYSTAEIVAHPGGRFVYASNRGHDSIAMFRVEEAGGRLVFLGTEPIRGKTPRNFCLDPGGRFLLAAGQASDTVTVFAIDPETGTLRFTGQSVPVPAPLCIRFLPLRPTP